MTTTLICDCNQTMPLDANAIRAALPDADTPLPLHSSLCRRQAGAFQQALASGDDVVVACTQEARLFTELAQQGEGAATESPIRFVNIRETGGWSRDARQSMPKIAALLAAAALPPPDPVATVGYRSQGRLLIVGPLAAAEQAAALLADTLSISIFSTGPGAGTLAQERRWPVMAGSQAALTGWLGAFVFQWSRSNPIDLDLCTRCNACIAACPEQAIGLDYQIDLSRCAAHRACVKACEAAGAIDFARDPDRQQAPFDLVLDLQDEPLIDWHAPPQGYWRLPGGLDGAGAAGTLLQLHEGVGEFEKPRFFDYKQKLCAHSRNEVVGCNACVQVCSAHAITSEPSRQRIVVNPNLCVGCGACTTVCPSGAMSYSYPRTPHQGRALRTLLATYARAGGREAVLLLHNQQGGQALIGQLGREAQLRRAHGVPANVIRHALWHSASTGIDLWLAAIAFGAHQVAVLCTGEEAPAYVVALREQMAIAQALLHGLGYSGTHLQLIEADTPAALDAALAALRQTRQRVPVQAARFAVGAEKRGTLEMALDHLVAHAPPRAGDAAAPLAVALPAGAPLGTITVDKDKCTLCLACVGACPASALLDNPQAPQLRIIEKNCVQCGLCESTCPEDAIELVPRYALTPERKQPVLLNEARPWACVRCGRGFGTHRAIEAMLGKLAGHAMFQGDALERLKMCGDCRVIDLYTAQNEVRITDT